MKTKEPISNRVSAKDKLTDHFAGIALNAILQGIYSDPQMLVTFQKLATENNRSPAEEVAKLSWEIAGVMVRDRKS